MVVFLICWGSAIGFNALSILIFVVEELIVFEVAIGISATGRVAGLEFSLLRSAAGGTGPCKAARRLLEQRRPDAVHVIRVVTYCTIDRVVTGDGNTEMSAQVLHNAQNGFASFCAARVVGAALR